MEVQIENLTGRPVILSLNSGEALHIAPRSISPKLLAVEVTDNAKVQKLRAQRIIAVHALAAPTAAVPAAPAAEAQGAAKAEAAGKESRAGSRRKDAQS